MEEHYEAIVLIKINNRSACPVHNLRARGFLCSRGYEIYCFYMKESSKSKGKKTVLVVEDDEFMLKAYTAKIEAEGWEICIAPDGNVALEFVHKQGPPDLVILDIMLPFVNGFEVLEQIRKQSSWKKVPVIVVSNLGQAEDLEKTKKLGADQHLIKSNVKINEIIEAAKAHI